MRRKVLIALHDAGGAAAVAPLIPHLKSIHECRVVAAAPARGQLPGVELSDVSEAWDFDLLLTGTSGGADSLDKAFTRQAKEKNVPVIAVLDYWSNYRQRFEGSSGVMDFLPHILCVMDETARREAIADGIPGEIIRVTGSPRFEALAGRRFDRVHLRVILAQAYGLDPERRWILFLSQPLAKVYGGAEKTRDVLGYCEADAAEIFRRNIPQACEALVRFHPAEDRCTGWTECKDISGGDVNELMAACEAVVGMSTVALLDACLMGVPVLSLQPGRKGPDYGYPSRRGWIPLAESEAQYRKLLDRLLRGDAQPKPPAGLVAAGAAETIVNLVAAVLKSGP